MRARRHTVVGGALLLGAVAAGAQAPPCADTLTIGECIEQLRGGAVAARAPAAPAAAGLCGDGETPQACHARLVNQALAAAETAGPLRAAADQDAKLQTKTTGADAYASRVAGTIRNFLPLLGGLVSNPVSGDDGRTLTLDLNLPVLSAGARTVQGRMVLTEPALAGAVTSALEAGGQGGAVAELEKELGDFDDVRVELSWSPAGARWGRSLAPHRAFLASLVMAAAEPAVTAARGQADDAWLATLQDLGGSEAMLGVPLGCLETHSRTEVLRVITTMAAGGAPPPDWRTILAGMGPRRSLAPNPGKIAMRCYPAEVRGRLERHLRASAEALAGTEAAIARTVQEAGVSGFAEFVNNQPQLVVSVRRRFAGDLVGPDETGVAVSYEWGPASLNRMPAAERTACAAAAAGGVAAASVRTGCLSRFQGVFGSTRATPAPAGERLAVAAEYRRRDGFHPALGAYGVEVNVAGERSLIASLAYGRYVFPPAPDGQQRARFDLVASWEDHGDDPLREDRFVASATLTQRVNGGFDFPITVTYASRPELLGEVTKKLSARVGFTYRLPDLAQTGPAD